MSSDNRASTLTIVPLGTTFFHGSLISHELTEVLSKLEMGKKALLLYNRRGSGRAYICRDCGHFPLCPYCDIALAYHTSPRRELVCHHCSHRSILISDCLKCQGSTFHEVGIGIQRVESDITKLAMKGLIRLDSDGLREHSHIMREIVGHEIILSTYATGLPLIHLDEVDIIAFLLFESELTLPDYRMEEDLYHTIEYAKKSGKAVIIQTYLPDHPLLEVIEGGNYKDFLQFISEERKKFDYPPYSEFVTIRIHDESKDRLQDMVSKLVNKIRTREVDDIFIAYDREARERSRGEWIEKIIIKGKNIRPLLDSLEVELVRNRNVTLDWN